MALTKLTQATGTEWKIIRKSEHHRDMNIAPYEVETTQKIYFSTERKIRHPYDLYTHLRRALQIDPEYPETYVKKSGVPNKVLIPARWVDEILKNDLPHRLLHLLCRSGRDRGDSLSK